MRRFLKILWSAATLALAASAVFAASLFFRDQPLPASLASSLFARHAPSNLALRAGSVSFGFRNGLVLRSLCITDSSRPAPENVLAAADSVSIDPFARLVRAVGAYYPRLPDSYYAPENTEKNARVEFDVPRLPRFSLELVRPDILSCRPETVRADVATSRDLVSIERIRLDWPDRDEKMWLTGQCTVDFAAQSVEGFVEGTAKQAHIRPFLVALDLPVSLPYIDGFTEVPCKVPARCGWKVNLVNNDFDMDLGLHPTLGKYNGVALGRADGDIRLHVFTRGDWLNYNQTFGPIKAVAPDGRTVEGTIRVAGTNGYNTVDVEAKGSLPVADLLRIGGFTGDYVGGGAAGDSECSLQFRFPRSMTNNYEMLDGRGSVSVKDGQLMRLEGFKGLLALLADKVPGVSWFTDTTQASCDYTIERGVVKSDNIYIEGAVFSIKMYGSFDAVKDALDFTARVQFTKKDTIAGKILHPLAWPFTKLLLEFRLTGSAANPEWRYVDVVERVLEAVR